MEYLGPVWLADVWPADDIPFCSIFTYFQYSLIHDLALKDHNVFSLRKKCIAIVISTTLTAFRRDKK